MPVARALLVSAVSVVAFAVSACDSVLGIQEYAATPTEEAGAAPAPFDSCGLAIDGGACGGCIHAHCCAQAEACAASSACAAYENCLVPCANDYACRSRCLVSNGVSSDAIPAMDQCVSSQCSAECELQCGMATVYTEPDAASACVSCLSTQCSKVEPCAGNLNCQQAFACAYNCSSEDCFYACEAALDDAGYPDLVSTAAATFSCSSCAVDEFWDCNPAPASIFNPAGSTTITFNLGIFPSGVAAKGVTVKACELSDMNCTSPVADPAVSDDHGLVTLVVPSLGNLGFAGYFDMAGPSVLPTLFFLQAPLSVPTVTFAEFSLWPSNGDAGLGGEGIWLSASDCLWVPAPNVTAHAVIGDAGYDFSYVSGGQLSPTATATDETGVALLLDPPTLVPITMTVTPLARPSLASTVTLFVRAGARSFIETRPQ